MRTSRPADGSRAPARRQTRRLIGPLLAALALAVLTAGPAMAQATTAAEVAAQLQQSPVYVDPDAGADISQDQLLERVREADTPIYIAVLPASARDAYGGDKQKLLQAIVNGVRSNATYLLLDNRGWETVDYAAAVPDGRAKALAEQAFNDHPNDFQAALLQWVDGVAAAAKGEPAAQSGGGGGVGIGTIAVLVALLVGGGALIFGARRRRREREAERQRELEDVKSVANEDLVALSDDIRAHDNPRG